MATERAPDAERAIRDWKIGLGARPTVRVEVLRVVYGKRPKLVGVLDELPDEETVMGLFGGGRYRLVVKRADARGRFTYAASATLDLAGDPRPGPVQVDEPADESRVAQLVRAAVHPLERRVA